MELKVKKLNDKAILPVRAHDDDAGYDLFATDDGIVKVVQAKSNTTDQLRWRFLYIEYATGLAIEPPVGYHIEIVARSSVSNTDLILANCEAIGDQGYRGEYKLRFKIPALATMCIPGATEEEGKTLFERGMQEMGVLKFKNGDKIAQLLIRKTESMNIVETVNVSDTERSAGGFGSTGA